MQSPQPPSAAHAQQLLHELQLHQIELDSQNSQLLASRAAAQAALARYVELFDWAPVGYASLDCAGQIKEANPATSSLLRLPLEELSGKRFAAFVAAADLGTFQHFLQQVFANVRRHSCELALASNGEPRFLKLTATRSADGLECCVVIEDVSATAAAKEAQRAGAQFDELLLRAMPFAVQIVDLQGQIIFANRRMQEIAGRPLLGKRCWSVHSKDQQQCSGCPLLKTFRLNESGILSCVKMLNGTTFEIHYSKIVLANEQPAVLKVFPRRDRAHEGTRQARRAVSGAEPLASGDARPRRPGAGTQARSQRPAACSRRADPLCQRGR